jgi:hypothetical protein
MNDYGRASLLLDPNQTYATIAQRYSADGVEGGGGDNSAEIARGQAALKQAQQYDPNAKFDSSGSLIFDRSKLPKWSGGTFNNDGRYTALSTNNAGDRVKDSRYVIHDNNYGDYTYSGNLKQASNDAAGGGVMGQLQTYMPAVISSIMAMASGGAVSPGLIQAITSASEGGGIMDLLRIIGSSVANSYVPGSGTAINLAAGAAQRGR